MFKRAFLEGIDPTSLNECGRAAIVDHNNVPELLENYAQLLRKLNRLEEAEPMEAGARHTRGYAWANVPDYDRNFHY